MVLVDGATGRSAELATQGATTGPGPLGSAFVSAGRRLVLTGVNGADGRSLRLTATTGTGTASTVRWRSTVPTGAVLSSVRSDRRGPLLHTADLDPVAPGLRRDAQLVQVDAATGGVLWRLTRPGPDTLTLHESGGDLLVTDSLGGTVERVSADTGATLWRRDLGAPLVSHLVGDLDVDGFAELYTSGADGATVSSGRTGVPLHAESFRTMVDDAAGVGDLDGDGHTDVVGTLSSGAGDLLRVVLGPGDDSDLPTGLTAISGRTGQVLWNDPLQSGSLSLAPATLRSGALDVLAFDPTSQVLRLFDGRRGTRLWDRDLG